MKRIVVTDGVSEEIDLTQEEQAEIEAEWAANSLPTVDAYRAAIVAMLDAKAKEHLYDSGVSVATYVGSTNPQWASEAAAFVAWRDAVWAYAYAELDKVMNAQRPQPTVAELVGELPTMQWPV